MVRLARVALVFAVVFTLVMAIKPLPESIPGSDLDKLQHVLAFFVLAVLSRLSFPRLSVFVPFAGLAALGALIEVMQMVPSLNRYADFEDWLADIIAAAAGLAAAMVIQRLLSSASRSGEEDGGTGNTLAGSSRNADKGSPDGHEHRHLRPSEAGSRPPS